MWSGLSDGQTAPTCSAEFPVGSQPYGTDGVAGCTIGINEYSCYITCPPQTNPPRIKKYIYMCNQSQINLWTWILTDTSNGCFANLNDTIRSEEHTSELQSLRHLVCRLLLQKK